MSFVGTIRNEGNVKMIQELMELIEDWMNKRSDENESSWDHNDKIEKKLNEIIDARITEYHRVKSWPEI